MPYQKPPLTVIDLDVSSGAQALCDERPATGLMQPFLGGRLRPQEIHDALLYVPDDPQKGERVWIQTHLVRAFETYPLLGVTFDAPRQDAVGEALSRVLCDKLPGIAWDIQQCAMASLPALQKYQILHLSIPAPPGETTGEAMALEIYGPVVRIITWGLEPLVSFGRLRLSADA